MKTLIFALVGVLGLTLGAPLAEARDKRHHHRDRDRKHHHHHHRHYRHDDRGYSYRYYTPRYYSYPRAYGYYGNGYYYHRRPGLTFSFGID